MPTFWNANIRISFEIRNFLLQKESINAVFLEQDAHRSDLSPESVGGFEDNQTIWFTSNRRRFNVSSGTFIFGGQSGLQILGLQTIFANRKIFRVFDSLR